ncbi:MAG TPA: polysaccharide biosynthesis C-terminal domain-containing protein, partial [Candidatus Woesebacteria bacterium]|nr:polysaccharide biosynthesis C-terminal domain-containing protein [Candidatus Woesebacteria bacterium]
FPWEATLLTGKVLAILTVSIFTQTINEILRRYFYVFKNTRSVLKIDGLATLFYLLFTAAAITKTSWGILGLAAGLSLANLCRSLMFLFALNRRIGPLFPKEKIISFSKMLLAAAFAALTAWAAMRFLDAYVFDTSRVVPLIGLTIVAALMGGLAYLLATKILKVEEFSSFKLMLKKGLRLW